MYLQYQDKIPKKFKKGKKIRLDLTDEEYIELLNILLEQQDQRKDIVTTEVAKINRNTLELLDGTRLDQIIEEEKSNEH